MKRRVKLVRPIEKVRLKALTAIGGKAYVGLAPDKHTTGGEATRLEFGLCAEDAAALGARRVRLGEKLGSTEHRWRGGTGCVREGCPKRPPNPPWRESRARLPGAAALSRAGDVR